MGGIRLWGSRIGSGLTELMSTRAERCWENS
jgi:hypothetical protein